MGRNVDVLLTAAAPAIWGSTYLVTTELLPPGVPLTVAMLRALPAGLILLLFVRELPRGIWLGRVFILGALNFSIFWWLLFVAAYRLPGGVAATVGAIQPLIVILLSRVILDSPIRALSIVAAVAGMAGVALLILNPNARLDSVGVVAGLVGAIAMAAGTVLTRLWRPPVPPIAFTAWQLTAGGLMLLPAALWFDPPLPRLTEANVLGFVYLGLVGGALTYYFWFRGLSRLEPTMASVLVLLSPATAVVLGWLILRQQLGPSQIVGMAMVLGSVLLGQYAQRAAPPATDLSVKAGS